MRVNRVCPTFRGESDVIIGYKDGKNAKNPYINNVLGKIFDDLRKENVSASMTYSNDAITISSAPQKMIKALADTDIVCRVQRGSKLKLII